jgi:hypothetical protein
MLVRLGLPAGRPGIPFRPTELYDEIFSKENALQLPKDTGSLPITIGIGWYDRVKKVRATNTLNM